MIERVMLADAAAFLSGDDPLQHRNAIFERADDDGALAERVRVVRLARRPSLSVRKGRWFHGLRECSMSQKETPSGYDPAAKAEKIIADRQPKTVGERTKNQTELANDAIRVAADELTRIRCELSALRRLASSLLERLEDRRG